MACMMYTNAADTQRTGLGLRGIWVQCSSQDLSEVSLHRDQRRPTLPISQMHPDIINAIKTGDTAAVARLIDERPSRLNESKVVGALRRSHRLILFLSQACPFGRPSHQSRTFTTQLSAAALTQDGRTFLHLAIEEAKEECARVLIGKGIDKEARNKVHS